jgi:N-methylhydantoinase A
MTLAEMACNLSRTVMRPGGADLEGDFQSLEARVCHELQEEGLDQAEMQLERRADLRYDGQSYELVVEAGTSEAPVPPDLLVQRFHQQHRHRFGHAEPELPVQVVTLRVRGSRRQPGDSTPALPAPGARPAPPPSEVRPALFEGRELPTAIHDRAQLEAGHHLQGPAIILEDHATTVVPPQTRLDVDAHLNLHLRLEELA